MLLPLAQALGVSATELLESHRIDADTPQDLEQVETIVKKAISFSGEKLPQRGGASIRAKLAFILCSCFSLAIAAYLFFTGGFESFPPGTITMLGLCFFFGIYFTFFAKNRLPVYYDEYSISSYSDGIFRFNLVGVRFSNRNWPHIVTAGRVWSCTVMAGLPLLSLALGLLVPALWEVIQLWVILVLTLGGLFIPFYLVGKKYQ